MSPVIRLGGCALRASPRGQREAPLSRRTWEVRAHRESAPTGGTADVPGDSMAAPA